MEDIDSEIAIISHAFAHFTFYVVSEFEDIVNYLRIYIFQKKYFTYHAWLLLKIAMNWFLPDGVMVG